RDDFGLKIGKLSHRTSIKDGLGRHIGSCGPLNRNFPKTFYGCHEAMVVTNSYFTRSAKELAESALVRLIDRDELQKYLDDYNQKIIEDFQSNS
ncbi:restriction endonuclease, partial [Escherichia coli]|uniref:restriction endonuclease n=1 Tax=Escherichia coli TaxID=562 RepID=UPI00203A6CFF